MQSRMPSDYTELCPCITASLRFGRFFKCGKKKPDRRDWLFYLTNKKKCVTKQTVRKTPVVCCKPDAKTLVT